MTKEAIGKLPTECKKRIETYSWFIKESIKRGKQGDREIFTKKLRGYLECLQDMKIISEIELRAIYLFYATI